VWPRINAKRSFFLAQLKSFHFLQEASGARYRLKAKSSIYFRFAVINNITQLNSKD